MGGANTQRVVADDSKFNMFLYQMNNRILLIIPLMSDNILNRIYVHYLFQDDPPALFCHLADGDKNDNNGSISLPLLMFKSLSWRCDDGGD